MPSSYAYQFRFILAGDAGVGKSCLLLRFAEKLFHPAYDITIGVDCRYQTITIENQPIQVQVWDTAGHERFRSLTRSYYRRAVGALLVYDVTRFETFRHLEDWLDELKRNCSSPNTTVMLVANKSDLPRHKRAVSAEDGERFARENGLLFMEVSAKSALNVDEAFRRIADGVYKKMEEGVLDFSEESFRDGIKVGDGAGRLLINPKTRQDDSFLFSFARRGGCCS